MVRIDPAPTNGLPKISAADCFQVRSVSQQRLSQRTGKVSDAQMKQIETALKAVLRLN
jgi:mRNA interferase MazF